MSGAVLWGVDPIGTEGLMSLVTRTVTRNILPSSHVLLRQVGAGHANNPTAAMIAGLDEDRLATILRQPVEEIARRRHPPRPEPGFVDFFGAAVRSDEMVFRRRRFGPIAVGASPHARATWSLKTVPCCTEHWQYLVDACECGAVQRWQSADRLDRCDVCNAPLATAPTTSVDPALHDGLGFLIGLLDPHPERRAEARLQLPPTLAGWDGGMVFELAIALMPLTADGYVLDRGRQPAFSDVIRYSTSLAQVAEILRCWPDPLIPLLEDRVRAHSVSRPNPRYKGTAHYLSSLTSEMLPPTVRGALTHAASVITSTPGSVPEDQIGMREAALLTGQEEHKLAVARRAGQFATRVCLRANRLLPTLDRGEVEALNDFLENRVGPDRSSHRLNLPQYAIHQIAAEGLLSLNEHPYVVAHYGEGQIHEDEFTRFRRALKAGGAAAGSIDDPVALHRAARAMGGGFKPWGMIIRSLLDGSIPYTIAGDTIDSITIRASDVVALRLIDLSRQGGAVRSRHVSQRDAVEVLNLPLTHAHLIPAQETAGGSHRIRVSRLRRLARERVTLAELSARTGIHGTRLESMLEKDGCPRSDAMGWMRRKALAKIASY